jgi:hypothetical protein
LNHQFRWQESTGRSAIAIAIAIAIATTDDGILASVGTTMTKGEAEGEERPKEKSK